MYKRQVYSTGIYQTFEAKAAELGLEIVKVTTFTDETTDFSVQVLSLIHISPLWPR